LNLPFDLSYTQIFFLAILFYLSSAIQGVLGFGFAVISSPIVVQINAELVPQLLSLLALPLAIRVFIREKEKVNLKLVRPLLLGRLVGGPIGTLLLLNLSTKYLSLSVGLIVLIGGVASYFGWVIKRNKTNSFLAGTFSGIFGMTAAVGGPPVALLYRNTKSEEFRPSLNSVFSFGIMITLTLLLFTGKLSIEHFYLFLFFIPFVLIGFVTSNKLFSRVSDSFISLAVTYFSIISGLFVILKNII